MKIEAVKVRRLYLEVASQIENLITSGQIEAGERLPSERDLAVRFEVSRPTIREAMIALEIAGLVEIRTGSGIYVRNNPVARGIEDVGPGSFEILEARLMIEPELAKLAAQRISESQLQELQVALDDMEREDTEGSVSEEADKRFHCIIAEAAGNSALAAIVTWLWDMRISSELSTLFHQRVREVGVHPSLGQHKRLFNALSARDAAAAEDAMRDHISSALIDSKTYLEA
ncbi:FadR/GntR family transcriptional regulator [Pseudomaricurvus sp. HS19]|uniref:FadR/GntR family transcriptional regulator n=1 Tax=Pseudomaricurvus sp. HS19 TaxID=2692626 RepID=UPI001369600A|nr:FadR/GntR family transcriptional regulator [Pseudomaricurvus sp. HS19]MYM62806.1 FCD domain-containing protein [Pseudomaricurvus sp. HS19]